MANAFDISQLAFLTQKENALRDENKRHFIAETLMRLDWRIFDPVCAADFVPDWDQTCAALAFSEPLSLMLNLRLLTEYLLFSETVPDWAAVFIAARLNVAQYLPLADLTEARTCCWRAVPVVLLGEATAEIRYLICGVKPESEHQLCLPDWATPGFDPSTLDALKDATEAAAAAVPNSGRHRFLAYPLAVPRRARQFAGSSLGLPAALGFMAALHRVSVPEGVIATGAVARHGSVLSVQRLEAKIQECAQRFKLLLYPAATSLPPENRALTAIPVATLTAAWTLTRLFAPETVRELALFAGMLQCPRQLVNNVADVPPEWIAQALNARFPAAIIADIARNPELFADLTQRFEAMVQKFDSPRAQTVSRLLTPAHLHQLQAHAPLSAFKWCAANLSLANHQGQIAAARHWSEHAAALIPMAETADLSAVVDYFNHYFVARHNRYQFSPGLPEELLRILTVLERQYAVQADIGCQVMLPLGRLYGTISQNFGFCGPDYLETMVEYSRKARTALGEGVAPEFKAEWTRQLNYLLYALLDAGAAQRGQAEQTLLAYLELPAWEALPERAPRLTEWEHAATARFLADSPEHPARALYYHLAGAPGGRNNNGGHPRQLWCYNMGRLAQHLARQDQARDWFARSLALCRQPEFGSTVRIMGLLPLSGLHDLRRLDDVNAAEAWAEIRPALLKVNPDHFNAFQQPELETALATLSQHPGQWFPFTYR